MLIASLASTVPLCAAASVTTAEQRNGWYGHYDPSREVRSPSGAGADYCRETFVRLCVKPIETPNQALQFLHLAAETLPSLHPIQRELQQQTMGVTLWDSTDPGRLQLFWGMATLLGLPFGERPVTYLSTLFAVVGSFMPDPPGLTLPPEPTVGTFDTLYRDLKARYTRTIARNLSFAYQLAHETSVLGVEIFYRGVLQPVLNAASLNLFRVFREKGLAGLAEAYIPSLLPDQQEHVESYLRRRAVEVLAQSKLAREPKGHFSSMGPQPALPRTALDEAADFYHRFEAGFEVDIYGWGRLGERDCRRVADCMEQPIYSTEDVRYLQSVVMDLAQLASFPIFSPLDEGRVEIEVTNEDHGQPVYMKLNFDDWCGLPSSMKPRLMIVAGTSVRQALEFVVKFLGRMSLPEEFAAHIEMPRFNGSREDLHALTDYLTYRYTAMDLWGETAWMAVVRQARWRGYELKLTLLQEEMEVFLHQAGFPVLWQQWKRFIPSAQGEQMEAMLLGYAHYVLDGVRRLG